MTQAAHSGDNGSRKISRYRSRADATDRTAANIVITDFALWMLSSRDIIDAKKRRNRTNGGTTR